MMKTAVENLTCADEASFFFCVIPVRPTAEGARFAYSGRDEQAGDAREIHGSGTVRLHNESGVNGSGIFLRAS